MRSSPPASPFVVLLLLAGCGADTLGTWRATVAQTESTGTPPTQVADTLEVTLEASQGMMECWECCTVTTTITGLEPLVAGGQLCRDSGLDVRYGQKAVPGVAHVEGLTELGLTLQSGAPSRLIVTFDGSSRGWSKTLSGLATRP